MKRLVSLVVLIVLLAGASSARAATCTKVASPGINLRDFVSALKPGDVGCLHGGTYGSRGTWAPMEVNGTATARITLTGYPGEEKTPPTILGQLALMGDYITVSGFIFDGPAGKDAVSGRELAPVVVLGADHAQVNRSEIRNSKSREGLHIGDNAQDARIVGDYIHDNGDFANPDTANLDHGIYFSSGTGLIANNVIEHNYAFGVHLYPSAHDVLVEHNTIVKNGRAGVIIASEPNQAQPPPANNRVVNNIIASNAQNAVTSYGPVGPGNVVENNIFWANGTAGSTAGLTMRGNISKDPQFVGAADYRLASTSPAIDTALSAYTQPNDYVLTPRPQRGAPDIGAYERPTIAPGIRGHVTASASDTTSGLTISRPASSMAGDLLLAAIVHQGGVYADVGTPPGWTAVAATDLYYDPTGPRTRLYYRVATGSEPTSYRFTISSGFPQDMVGAITAFTGVDPSKPINVAAGQSNASGGYEVTAPSVSPSWRNTRLVFVGASGDPATWTPPPGTAERFELSSAGAYEATMEVATQPLASNGATGQRKATMSIWWPSIGVLLALNPAR